MTMFSHIFHFEYLLQARSKTGPVLFLIVSVLLLATIYTHWQHQTVLSEAQQSWQDSVDKLWAKQPDRHPHRVAHYGHVVVRPQAPLSFIEPGVNPYIGNYLFLEAHRQNSSSVKSASINPVILRMGYPSVALVILVMWPLLIIVMGYGAFSNEWDSGRLYWLSSQGVSVWQLFIGKYSILASYSLAMLILTSVASVVLLGMSGDISANTIYDLLLLFSLFAVYVFIWLALVLIISFYSKNSQQSLWRLLTLWLLLCIVIPKSATGVAEFIYPTPDKTNFDVMVEKAVQAVGDSHNPDDPHFSKFKSKILSQYNVESVEELPVNWKGLLMAEGERITSEIFQQHYDKILAQFEAQDKLRLWFGLASPALAAQHISQNIAKTDRASAQHFEMTAEAFRYDLIQRLNHLHSHKIKKENDSGQKISSDVWKAMKLFEYSPPEKLTPKMISIVMLVFWCLLAVGIIFIFQRREITR